MRLAELAAFKAGNNCTNTYFTIYPILTLDPGNRQVYGSGFKLGLTACVRAGSQVVEVHFHGKIGPYSPCSLGFSVLQTVLARPRAVGRRRWRRR
jgi:hypothetical protein